MRAASPAAVISPLAMLLLSLGVASSSISCSPSLVVPPAQTDTPTPRREVARARLAAERGDFEAALESVDAALQSGVDDVATHLFRAELLFRLHRSDEMIGSLERVLELAPGNFEARANLAYAFRYVGRLNEAEQLARSCVAERPDFVPVRRVLAEIHRDRGDIEAALVDIEQALSFQPEDLEVHLLKADIEIFQQQYETAYQRLRRLAARHPHHPRLLTTLVRLARLTGHSGAAREYQSALDALKPPSTTDQKSASPD